MGRWAIFLLSHALLHEVAPQAKRDRSRLVLCRSHNKQIVYTYLNLKIGSP